MDCSCNGCVRNRKNTSAKISSKSRPKPKSNKTKKRLGV